MGYKLLKNVRYKKKSHKIGEEIEINKTDIEAFVKAGAIEVEEEEDDSPEEEPEKPKK